MNVFLDGPIFWHIRVIMFELHIGTPKTINFPFGTNGKLMILCVPVFKNIRVLLQKIF